MALAAGSRLGPYEILGQIGAGGMGEVYRAKDPRLGREVAIKVLPASFSQDADRLRRFEQEAKAAGVLNHPNITAVYDIGSHDDAPYVVQELLEGETLRSELAGGRLSPRKAIEYALQIAHGLAAAHEKGIVHRDLKPENLFVTQDGRVKILDFGLAKLTHQEEGSQVTNLPTATAGTEPGVVLGTLGYMSPEQVRGRPADARSDIFSFGAILYEMLSGKRAFHGDSAADTMSAILKEDPPDLSVTNQKISPGLERIVRHCLEKNPEQRFHSAHDLAFDLEALSGTSATSAGAMAAQTGRPAAARREAPARCPRPRRARRGRYRRPLRLAPREALGADLPAADVSAGQSRDGPLCTGRPQRGLRRVFRGTTARDLHDPPRGAGIHAHRRQERQPDVGLGVGRSRGLGARTLPGGAGGIGTLATVPLGGGAPRSIAEFVERAEWMPDGKQLALVRFLEGKNRLELPLGKVLYKSDHSFRSLRVSPKGDWFAITERAPVGRSIVVIDLAGKARTLIPGGIQGQGLAWSPSGDEVWFDDRGEHGQFFLKAVDLSGRVRTLVSTPVGLIIHDVARDGRCLVERYGSRPGMLGLVPGETRERDFSWFDGSRLVSMSDDGKLMLFNENGDAAGGIGAHYLRKTDGSPAVNLGPGAAFDLSPDGKWVLVRPADSPNAIVLQPTGTGAAVSVDVGAFESVGNSSFFPDGKRLLVSATEPGKKRMLYVLDIPAGKPRAIAPKSYGFAPNTISPDGLWIAAYGEWTEDAFLLPTSGGEPRTLPGTKDIDLIRWSADGKSIFAVETGSIPARVVRIDVATGRREPWKTLAPPELAGLIDIGPVVMTPDGKSYAYGYGSAAISDLYLIEGLK